MNITTIAGVILALAIPAAAHSKDDYWKEVWEKDLYADSPETIEWFLSKDQADESVVHFIASEQLNRLTAGLPVNPLVKASKRYGVSRWTGLKSTCTPEDQRQYRRSEAGGFTWADGRGFFYGTFHRVRGKDWDPCAVKIKPHLTRMEPVLRTDVREVKN